MNLSALFSMPGLSRSAATLQFSQLTEQQLLALAISLEEDDARIYNRALSAQEVSQLYASTVPNLEHATGSSGVSYPYYYYLQQPVSLGIGATYESLGQRITTTVAGTYWVDANYPVEYLVGTA